MKTSSTAIGSVVDHQRRTRSATGRMTVAGAADVLATVFDVARDDLAVAEPIRLADAAARTCLDALACIASGMAQMPRGALDGLSEGPVPLVGRTTPVDVWGAARLMAVASHLDDLDDVHWPSVTHPGSVIWPVVLAVAAELPFRRAAFAATLGYQVAARLGMLLGPAHRAVFHATSTAGAIGAAAAVTSLRGGGREATLVAMAHAASMAGGSAGAVRQRTRTAAVHRAGAGVLGLTAASFADLVPPVVDALAAGMPLGADLRTESLRTPLGPAIAEVTQRVHPVAGFAHTIVDALLELEPLNPDDILQVDVTVPSFVVDAMGAGEAAGAPAAWDLPGVVAQALLERSHPGRLGQPLDATASRLRARCRVHTRPTAPPDLAAEALVALTGGRTFHSHRDVPDGHPARPLPDEALMDKALRLGATDAGTSALLLAGLRDGDALTSALLSTTTEPPSTHVETGEEP